MMAMKDSQLNCTVVGQSLIKKTLDGLKNENAKGILNLIQGTDISFTNFEGTIMGKYGGWPTKDDNCNACSPAELQTLKNMGFNALSLANNHAFDLGPGGVLSTLEVCDALGFLHSGTGIDFTDATSPRYSLIQRKRIALIALDSSGQPDYFYAKNASEHVPSRPGLNRQRGLRVDQGRIPHPEDTERNLSTVRQAADNSDFVMVSIHNHYWEPELEIPSNWLQEFCRLCIDAGANIIAGHGVPLLQGLEIYRNRPIFYSLGNFIFHTNTVQKWYDWTKGLAWKSIVAKCCFNADGNLTSAELIPIIAGCNKEAADSILPYTYVGAPRLADTEECSHILNHIAQLSEAFGTNMRIDCNRGKIIV